MPKYAYRAKRGPREVVEGVLEAENPDAVVTRLTEEGFVPIKILPVTSEPAASSVAVSHPGGRTGRVRSYEITFLTRQLASLMRSSVPILQALELIRSRAERPPFKRMVGHIQESVRQGKPLSEAFSEFAHLFPPLYCNLVRAGELSGRMDDILARLLEYRDQQETFRSKVEMAFVYPLFLVAVGVATVAVLLGVVMPRLNMLFEGLQQTVPWPTQLVMGVSHVVARTWWMWLAGGVILLALVPRMDRQRALLSRLQLLFPFWRDVTRKAEVARFCRTLGLLLENGIPILQAVNATVPTIDNRTIRQSLASVEPTVAAGTPLSQALEKVPAFSPFVIGVIAIGEGSGELPRHLTEVAVSFESDVERTLKVVTTLLEPFLILVLGLVVGLIVAAMLLPIFEIGSGTTLD